jgi:ribosomal protein L7/L12
MDMKHLLIAAGIVAALFIVWTLIKNARKERPREARAPAATQPTTTPAGAFPPLSRHVMEIASDPGRKISAIKAYREETGLGLKEAKDAVEAWIASGARPIDAAQHGAAYSPSASAAGASFEPSLSQRVKDIARDPSHKIAAIKAYREETGAGLAEAKNAIEAWRRSEGLE